MHYNSQKNLNVRSLEKTTTTTEQNQKQKRRQHKMSGRLYSISEAKHACRFLKVEKWSSETRKEDLSELSLIQRKCPCFHS